MKKILIVLILMVATMFAEGFVIGGELGYGKINAEASYNGNTATADTKYTSFAVRAGYEQDNMRLLGYINSDKYKEDMLVVGEGNAISYGVEFDLVSNMGLYAGVLLGTGSKDFIVADVDFNEYGVRGGYIYELSNSMQFETGVQYKQRDYDSYEGIDMQDDLIGLYVGINFML